MKQTFFLRDRVLGSRDIPRTYPADPLGHAAGARFRCQNLALFCPVCGEIWGRVLYEETLPTWRIEARYCASHGSEMFEAAGWFDYTRGSFIYPYPDAGNPLAFASNWPEEVVRYECNLLLSKLPQGELA